MKYKAIIFDLDGVVVSTDNCHYEAWKQLADEEGIYFDRTINERLRGVSRMESLEIVLENIASLGNNLDHCTPRSVRDSYTQVQIGQRGFVQNHTTKAQTHLHD